MEVILRLLSELRLVLIAIAGICCAAFVFTGLSSLRELRRAVFRLERSAIIGRAIGAWLKAGVCVIAGVAIWAITGVAPDEPSNLASNPLSATPTPAASTVEPTAIPTADLSNAAIQMTAAPTEATTEAPIALVTTIDPSIPLPTQTDTPSAASVATVTVIAAQPAAGLPTLDPRQTPSQGAGASQGASAAATGALPLTPDIPTLPPATAVIATVAPADTPTSPPVEPASPASDVLNADCPHAAARIDSPGAGETVTGSHIVRGTADFPGGSGRYKLEILRPNIPGWAFLWENHNAVKGGILMPKFDATLFPPGVYTLRLSLIDGAGQETGIYCSVQIRIS